MKKVKFIFLVMIALSSAASAMSEDEQINYNAIQKEYEKADAQLNVLYKQQMEEFKRQGAGFYGQKESRDIYLKRSQQAWIKSRDTNCGYETYESLAGTGFSSIYSKCLLDKTNERIIYLKNNK